MASDGYAKGNPEFKGFCLSLAVKTEGEADKLFAALGDGGKVEMPLGKTFFSPKFGMVQDKFGVGWMVLVEHYGVHGSDCKMGVAVIQGHRQLLSEALMAFGDIRVAERADWLIDRMVALGTVVLRRIGETRSGEMAVHRFLSSPYVLTENIVTTCAARTVAQCRGRRILTIQDTSEINFAGRDKKRRGLGPAGNGKTAGFFIHPEIAVDVETEAVIGLVDATIWTRRMGKSLPRRDRPFEEKARRAG